MSSVCCDMLLVQLRTVLKEAPLGRKGFRFESLYRYRDTGMGFELLESARRIPKDYLLDPSFRDYLSRSDYLGVFTNEYIDDKNYKLKWGCSPHLVDYIIRRELIIRSS